MKRYLLIAALCLAPGLLWAHAGEKHAFPMVVFARPIPAPDFRLRGLGGEAVRLAGYRGRYVLLNFWATWCPACVQEMPSMERLHRSLGARGLAVLAVSQDESNRAHVRSFARRLKLTFPVALDPEQAAGGSFGVRDLPSTFLISPTGTVVAAVKGGLEWDSPAAVEFLGHYLESQPQPYQRGAAKP